MSALLDDVITTLGAWQAPTAAQGRLRDAYLTYLAAYPDALWRQGPPEHLTASCFVLDPPAERVLLTLHRKGGFWVQFGGHLEPGDTTLAGAALREGVEESGVDGLRLLSGVSSRPGHVPEGVSGGVQPVDLHRHALPPAFGRCREHLDVAFLALAPADATPVVSAESHDVAWWPVGALPASAVPDVPGRLAAVVRAVRSLSRS